jgi:quercetin dioxygenase-like cupin family protein
MDQASTHDLGGWQLGLFDDVEWSTWGSKGNARAKVLAMADGYVVALVQAEPGYAGDAHEHSHAEFLYVVEGSLRTQRRTLAAGDAYAAAAGSVHTDFATDAGATYLSIFKL